jgi:ABC-2 type transport system ATP-binding protein
MAPSSSASIVVDGVDKEFTLRYHRTFKQVTVALAKGRDISNTFKALDDISFSVEQGESIGLMGLNGSRPAPASTRSSPAGRTSTSTRRSSA